MKPLTFALFIGLLSCREGGVTSPRTDGGIERAIAGECRVVMTRNFPEPEPKELVRMPQDLHLGRSAFAAEASDVWLQMLEKLEPGAPRNELPVLFAKSFVFADGVTRLVVGQLQCGPMGDGAFAAGSSFVCVLYTIDISDPAKPTVLWKGTSALGTLQNSRILRRAPGEGAQGVSSLVCEESLNDREILRSLLVFQPAEGCSVTMVKQPFPEE